MERVRTGLAGTLGTYLVMLGATLPYPLLDPFIVERFSVGELAASTYVTVNLAAYVLVAPLVGRAIHRVDHPNRLLALAVASQGLLLAVQPSIPSLAALFGIRFLEGAATITALTVLHTQVLEISGPRAAGAGAGAIGLGLALGVATGSALGGVLGARSIDAVFLGGGALLVLAALPLANLVQVRQRSPGSDPDEESVGPLALLRAKPRLWVPTAFSFLDRLTVGFLVTTLPLTLGSLHGLGTGAIGLAMSTFLLAFALGQMPSGRVSDRIGPWPLIAGGSLVYGLLVAAIPHVGGRVLWVVLGGAGLAGAVMFAPSLALAAQLAPARKGPAVALFHQAGSLGFALGPLAGGALLATLGSSVPFGIAGAVEVIAALLLVAIALRWPPRSRVHPSSVKMMTP